MNPIKTKYIKIFFFIAFCCILTPVFGGGVIKILAIGNSFSEDAAESYVDDLAKANNIDVIIGNICIGHLLLGNINLVVLRVINS